MHSEDRHDASSHARRSHSPSFTRRLFPRTDDTIYWTGHFKRPTVGSQKPEPLPANRRPSSARTPGAPSERIPGRRERSGDMAYEFSNSELVFDLKMATERLRSSVLVVWKKDGGPWKIARTISDLLLRPRLGRHHLVQAVIHNELTVMFA